MNVIIAVGFMLMLVTTLFYFYFFNLLRKTLETKYESDYKEMGKPNLFTNSTIENNKAFKKYLSEKHYLKHNDDELNTLCVNVSILLYTGYLFTGITIALFVLNAFQLFE